MVYMLWLTEVRLIRNKNFAEQEPMQRFKHKGYGFVFWCTVMIPIGVGLLISLEFQHA